MGKHSRRRGGFETTQPLVVFCSFGQVRHRPRQGPHCDKRSFVQNYHAFLEYFACVLLILNAELIQIGARCLFLPVCA